MSSANIVSAARGAGRRRAAATLLALDYANLGLTTVKGIVLVPLYLRSFDLGVYGAWLAWSNVLAVVGSLEGGLGLVVGERVARSYGAADEAALATSAGAGVSLAGLTGMLIALIGLGAAPLLASGLSTSPDVLADLRWAFLLAAVGAGLSVVHSMIQTILRALQSPWSQGSVRVSALLLDVASTIAGLVAGLGVVSLGLGSLVGGLVGALVGAGALGRVWRASRFPRAAIKTSHLRGLAAATAPLFGSRIAGAVLSNAETAIVAFLVSPAVAGMLGLTDRIYKVGLLAVNPVASAVFPGLAHLAGQEDPTRVREVVREIIGVFTAVAAFVVPTAMAVNASFTAVWVGGQNFGGTSLSIMLAVAASLTARQNLLWWLLAALGDVQRTVWANLFEMALRVGLMAFLVWRVGMLGVPMAVIATTLAFGFWYYTGALASRLGVPVAGIRLTGLGGLVAALVAGGVMAEMLPRAAGWSHLALNSGLAAAVIATAVLAVNTDARRTLARRFG